MNEVTAVETINAIDLRERTDTLDAVDFGDAVLETKQFGPPLKLDNAFVFASWG